MSADIPTLNLSDPTDGMVPINNSSASFVEKMPEKNILQNKETMDSTPIADIMGQPQDNLDAPMMAMDPRVVQQQMMAQPPAMVSQTAGNEGSDSKKKNPLDLSDDQMQALIVAACCAAAVSKPVQDKLATTIPQFVNAQGNRSFVGLASTGLVAAVIFYFARRYF
jgi:hypothetical protein